MLIEGIDPRDERQKAMIPRKVATTFGAFAKQYLADIEDGLPGSFLAGSRLPSPQGILLAQDQANHREADLQLAESPSGPPITEG